MKLRMPKPLLNHCQGVSVSFLARVTLGSTFVLILPHCMPGAIVIILVWRLLITRRLTSRPVLEKKDHNQGMLAVYTPMPVHQYAVKKNVGPQCVAVCFVFS